jgi:HSP20 family molecular chaperone IbpA
MDVIETPDKICYHFELPGISDKGDINLTIDNNVLHVDCKKPEVNKNYR